MTSPVLHELIANIKPEDVFTLHMDEHGQGKGAYYIFNNTTSEKDSKLAGDKKRSVAHIEDNPQLGVVGQILKIALRICQKLGLCSEQHELHVPVS